MKTIKIAHLYYDLMNLYGENGNVRYLKKKLEDQDVEVKVYFLSVDDEIDFSKYDIYYIGTGSEDNQKIVLEDIMKYKDDIKKAIDDNKYFISTGNSLELFGKEIIGKDKIKCLDIFNYTATVNKDRIVGEQLYSSNLIDKKIVGFQNRVCTLDNLDNTIFNVTEGSGYNKKNMTEGFRVNNFIGTYLLGPILVRNPYLCDYFIKDIFNSLEINYNKPNYNDTDYKAYNEYMKNFYE